MPAIVMGWTGDDENRTTVAIGPLSSDRTQDQAIKEMRAHDVHDIRVVEITALRDRASLWEAPTTSGEFSAQDEPGSGTDDEDLLGTAPDPAAVDHAAVQEAADADDADSLL